MPKVLNKHTSGIPEGAVYIGRGSPWGNPYVIGRDGDRVEVIAKHESRLRADAPQLARIAAGELKGKDLVCFCAPARCHGDLLLRLGNGSRADLEAWRREGQESSLAEVPTSPSGTAAAPAAHHPLQPGPRQTPAARGPLRRGGMDL